MKGMILLIEDSEQNAYLVDYLLGARGWEVVPAAGFADQNEGCLGKQA